MRYLLSMLLLCAMGQYVATVPATHVSGGGATITFEKAAGCNTSGASCNISITATNSTDTFLVGLNATYGSTLSISDSHNTYTAMNAAYGDTDTKGETGTFIATNVGSSALTVTCTSSSSADFLDCTVFDVAISGTVIVDKTPAGATYSSTTAWATNASGTTSAANEILFACFGNAEEGSTIPTAGASWTIPTNGYQNTGSGFNGFIACEYQIVSATGSYTGTMTGPSAQDGGALLATVE